MQLFVIFEVLPIALKQQPQNLDTVADQQEPLTDFQQQVLKGYEEDSDWFDKLTAAEQRKCE